jgi:hypothetical protein
METPCLARDSYLYATLSRSETPVARRAPSDVVSPQHDDRLIVERLSACSKIAERCGELSTECFGRPDVETSSDAHGR